MSEEKGLRSYLKTASIIVLIFASFVAYRHYTAPTAPKASQSVASKAELNEKRLNDIMMSNMSASYPPLKHHDAINDTTASASASDSASEQNNTVDKTEFQKTSEAFAKEAQKQAQEMNARTKNNGFEVLRQIGVGFQ